MDEEEEEEEESYEDPDQTPLKGKEATLLIHAWAGGFDYTPRNRRLSPWFLILWRGDYDRMLQHLHGLDGEELRRLLERRESGLRLSSIFHPIQGARAYHCTHPAFDDNKSTFAGAQLKHMECLVKLLDLGAKINVHDVAGYTPLHHCLTMYGTAETMGLALVLLERGADPNARTRLGNVPLCECVRHQKIEFIKLLLEFGADPAIPDKDGVSPQRLAAHIAPHISVLFSKPLKEKCQKMRQHAKEMGGLKKCRVCLHDRECKRCSGCYMVWYCGKECQQKDWTDHKENCKKTLAQYTPVSLMDTKGLCIANFNHMSATFHMDADTKTTKPAKSHFVVKVQVPLNLTDSSLNMLVYNRERTVFGYITLKQNPSFYPLIDKKIRTVGFNRNKGYFYAIWCPKQGLRINPHEILPVEVW